MKTSFLFRFLTTATILVCISCLTSACETDRTATQTAEDNMEQKEYAIAIHGGAGVISRDLEAGLRDGYLAALDEALTTGRDLLAGGGSSLDAVETVIRFLEDDERFNAGKGAVFTNEGNHELDASIMDGRDLNAGAVAAVRTVKNPITLARKVMEESRHVMFAADGAEQFADRMGVERVENSYFSTDRRREQLERAQEQALVLPDHTEPGRNNRQIRSGSTNRAVYGRSEKSNGNGFPDIYSTVGVVALDRNGNLAAGTSTGGMTNKRFGRIGDSPIIAAGTYADNNTCAVSATGHGEKFIRNAAAYQICAGMEYGGLTLREAAERVIHEKLDEGDGGIIAVDRFGNIVLEFSTPGMFRGAADSDGLFETAIWE